MLVVGFWLIYGSVCSVGVDTSIRWYDVPILVWRSYTGVTGIGAGVTFLRWYGEGPLFVSASSFYFFCHSRVGGNPCSGGCQPSLAWRGLRWCGEALFSWVPAPACAGVTFLRWGDVPALGWRSFAGTTGHSLAWRKLLLLWRRAGQLIPLRLTVLFHLRLAARRCQSSRARWLIALLHRRL